MSKYVVGGRSELHRKMSSFAMNKIISILTRTDEKVEWANKIPRTKGHTNNITSRKIIAACSLVPKSTVSPSRVFKVMLNKEMGLSQIYKN